MQNLITLYLFLVSFIVYGQQKNEKLYQIGYRMEYISDSTNLNDKRMEDFTLFIDNNQSYFTNNNFLKSDSIIRSMQISKNLSLDFSNVPKTRFKYIVVKENNKVSYYETLLKYKFAYSEQPLTNWKITNETLKIGTYNCQKATIDYGGREWTAWYTIDIPINDGPYKFANLPGLIVKISDSKQNYSFELISIKKGVNLQNVILEEKYFQEHKKLSKEDYFKAVKNINNNIIGELSGSGFTVSSDSEEKVRSNMRRRNNPIELYK